MDIYEQHEKAFNRVSAFVVMRDGKRVATVAIKFPADGAGRLWAYVHWLGVPMVRGYANGYGYDKRTAAVSTCAAKVMTLAKKEPRSDLDSPADFCAAIAKDSGDDWTRSLEKAGFTVHQAV